MALIKSHSNYVLKKKHQEVSDGTIYERDITTIGGLDQYAKGQTPIYRSNNFIITVRNDGGTSNQYNSSKWEENNASGSTWTLESISGITSEFEDDNDLKIVLKQDYYDLSDFAYYGSLTELFRASVNDIVSRFPGELYGTENNNIYYTITETIDGESIDTSVILGGDNLYEVNNPFGIDLHSAKLPKDANPLKFFAESGYTEYELFTSGATEPVEIISYNVVYVDSACKGKLVAEITINGIFKIEAWVGDGNMIFYLSRNCQGLHIRPKEKHIAEFYNGCDNFEKILMNRKTTPRYKATFSVIKENEHGYYRELQDFTFPTTYGGYNIDATDYGFNDYTNRMIEVGEFYDDRFTDNMWRSMTHEAIKNFDWTYTREYQEGDEEEYVLGGERMQKALRVFAREFDEIISFINNIKNINSVTYDERNNIPDYFLTDVVENEGWDVKFIYPFNLTEYVYNGDEKIEIGDDDYTEEIQSINTSGDSLIFREFSQNSTINVNPYSKKHIKDNTQNGYFIACCISGDYETFIDSSYTINSNNFACSGGTINYRWDVKRVSKRGDEIEILPTPTRYKNNDKFILIDAQGRNTYYDSCALSGKGVLKDRIKTFTDEKSYTYKEVNDEFLRRLKINSKGIWKHKGTIEGVEMILGMFGLKSKRYYDKLNYAKSVSTKADYEIVEYSSFANYIVEKWDAVHQMYRIDWINSTKMINYDNRSVSNYDTDGDYARYQGIPVAYKDVEGSYLKRGDNTTTVFSGEAYTREDGSLVNERRLYPSFNKNEEYDGNPYFQMNGGWLSKVIASGDTKLYNFQYDLNSNIILTKYLHSGGTDESGFIVDNEFLYKETIRNIRRTDSIRTLLHTPTNQLRNGTVFYVTSIEKNIMVIDGDVFDVIDEYYNGNVLHCIELIKNNGYIRVGNKFFDDSITVYGKDGQVNEIALGEKENGYSVYAYIKNNGDFICSDYEDSYYAIEDYVYISGDTDGDTNYFILDDVNYSYTIAKKDGNDWTSGWRRLNSTDKEYLKLNTIENYYKGNNAHNGNMVYDNGHEYFTYFNRLFKHAIDNDLFDERCYSDYYVTIDDEIATYGFSGLVETNERIKQYDSFLIPDVKIHYFGNYIDNGGAKHEYSSVKEADFGTWDASNGNVNPTDEVTNQIVNNKRMVIKFNLHYDWYSKNGQEEIKYLDDIVMSYLTQMIPSTTILEVIYVSNSYDMNENIYQTEQEATNINNNEQESIIIETHKESEYVGKNCGNETKVHSKSWSGVTITVPQEACEFCCGCSQLKLTLLNE